MGDSHLNSENHPTMGKKKKKKNLFQLKFTRQLYEIIQALNKLEMGAKEKVTMVSHILGHFLSFKEVDVDLSIKKVKEVINMLVTYNAS